MSTLCASLPTSPLGIKACTHIGWERAHGAGSCSHYWVLAGTGIVPKLMQLYEDAYRDSGSKLSPTAQAALVVEQPEIKVEPRAEPAS